MLTDIYIRDIINLPEMYDITYAIEPTITLNGILILLTWMSGLSSWKADHQLRTPNLAKARRQMEGNGIPDLKKEMSHRDMALFLKKYDV